MFANSFLRISHGMLVGCVWILLIVGVTAEKKNEVSFNRDVLPILSSKCFQCHGPDRESRKAGLRLDVAEAVGHVLKSGRPAIVPGQPSESELLSRVKTTNEEDQMPPKDSGKVLSENEIRILTKWVEEGAEWRNHWAFEPLAKISLPVLPDHEREWVRNSVDQFIRAEQIHQGLDPNPEASPAELIRRLYFDLVGLPPSPAEITAFVEDRRENAYEHLVDRLLSSPQYGERWARHWLDVVHYADTQGYDKDKLRLNAWPYRDYVIESFNSNKNYSRFVHEQLAGDYFYPGSADGIRALGFIAAGPWDFIGHVEVSESKFDGQVARMLDRDDMVSNTMNAFSSLTVQCARCHDHKFDPVDQKAYYRLQAVFAAVDRANRVYDEDPEVLLKREAGLRQLAEWRTELKDLEAQAREASGERLKDLEERLKEVDKLRKQSNKPTEVGYHSEISDSPNTEKWVQIDLGEELAVKGFQLVGAYDDFAGIGAGFGFPVRFKVEASSDAMFRQDVQLWMDRTESDFANPGVVPVEVLFENERLARYVRVTATRLAYRQNDHIFALGEMEIFGHDGKSLANGREVSALDSIEAHPRWRRSNLVDGLFVKTIGEGVEQQWVELNAEKDRLLLEVVPEEKRLRKDQVRADLETLEASMKALPEGRLVFAAATHFNQEGNFKPTQGNARPIHVLHRGDLRNRMEKVTPGVPPLIPGFAEDLVLEEGQTEASYRGELAEWLTRKDHPLTWRSYVNRVWQYHFGRGLVDSPNDFGRMGQPPSHPELLDWLATEFRDGQQSTKWLHRLIVLSATYRQSSAIRSSAQAIDGSNQFLWRMNRRRLDAESIRDSILAVSGQLRLDMGGPGFYLFEIEKPEHSPHFQYHLHNPGDPRSHRRSIYRFIVRSQPDPYMTTLDCADSSQSVPKRNETLSPLQAMTLLNNPFTLVMAEKFARDLEAERTGLRDQIELGYYRVTGRNATNEELAELSSYAEEFGLDNLCRVLLNLSEFIFID